MTKRMLSGTLAAAATAVALAMPSQAPATEPVAPSSAAGVCGSMKPVDCVVYYLTRWDPCLLCDGGEDATRRQ